MVDDCEPLGEVPDTPPAEVLHALDMAQQVVSDLRSHNLELRFEVGEWPARAQLINGDGNIVCEIPARQGLDVLAGTPAVD
jgi:hypothetical protein